MIDPITMTMLSALGPPAYAMVCTVPTAPVQDAAQASEAVDEIIASHENAYQEFIRKYQACETNEERQALLAEGVPSPASKFEELRAIAMKYRGSDAAGKAAAWVLNGSRGNNDTSWALDMLLDDFIESDHIADIPLILTGMTSKNVEGLERIRKHAKSARARALADYARGSQLVMLSKAAEEIAEPGSSGNPYMSFYMNQIDDELREHLSKEGMAEECLKEGEKLLELCVKSYKDIELYPGYMSVAAKSEGDLFELRHLQIGMPAPDIEGVDAEGVAFKLSDYKGQVVMLDFWGFW